MVKKTKSNPDTVPAPVNDNSTEATLRSILDNVVAQRNAALNEVAALRTDVQQLSAELRTALNNQKDVE